MDEDSIDLGVSWRQLDVRKFCFFGSTVYLTENFLVYPLEIAKVRLQVAKDKETLQVWKGLRKMVSGIVARDGYRGLYRGYTTAVIAAAPSQLVYILSYKMGTDYLHRLDERIFGERTARRERVWVTASAAVVADAISHIFYTPPDVIAQRLQAGDPRYRGGIHAARTIYATEGVRGLYRGLGASLIATMPASAIWWGVYENAKHAIVSLTGETAPHWMGGKTPSEERGTRGPLYEFWTAQNRVAQLTAGGIAGTVTTLVLNPLDVCKTRVQTQKHASTMWTVLKTTLQTEGVGALTRGVGPKVIMAACLSSFSSVSYEVVLLLSRRGHITLEQ